jgi:hypothetical protein
MTTYELWDPREAETPPDADVVVLPAFRSVPPERDGDALVAKFFVAGLYQRCVRFVLPFVSPLDFVDWRAEWCRRTMAPWPSNVVPALYAETQASLDAGICDLDDETCVGRNERRALVLCPRQEIDLVSDQAVCKLMAWAIDLVLVVPPTSLVDYSETSRPAVRGGECAVCLHAPPLHEPSCPVVVHGAWPMHPAWVQKIVEQSREAEVPVAFLGWGDWCPVSDVAPPVPSGTEEGSVRRGPDDCLPILTYRLGREKSGRTLNDAPVADELRWARR